MKRRQAKKIVRNGGIRGVHGGRGFGKAWSMWAKHVHRGEKWRLGKWCPGPPEWRRAARGAVEIGPMRLWWLSFAAEDGFRGACQVWAPSYMLAIREAHRLGCNPGGEVKGMDLDPTAVRFVDEKYIGVLMNEHDCEIFDALMEEKIKDAGFAAPRKLSRSHLQRKSEPQP